MMRQSYGSRRFLLALAALAMGSLGMLLGRDLAAYSALVGTVLAGYGFTRSPFVEGRKKIEVQKDGIKIAD